MSLPTPYYEEAGIVIYHGDCRDYLPYLPKVDLVLTDPPYGINYQLHLPNYVGQQMTSAPIFGDDSIIDLDPLFQAGEAQIIFGVQNFLTQLPSRGRWICWLKRSMYTSDSMLGSHFELAWDSSGGYYKCFNIIHCGAINDNSVSGRNNDKRSHPTEKPIRLLQACLNLYPKANTVLDPYMGSGTTLRAAKDLGRKAIGIEIEEKYCAIAVERLRQEVLPL